MKKQGKILFLIPDGVGIRNYLYSDVLSYVKQEAEIAFWSPLPEDAFEQVKQLHNIEVEYKNLKLNTESILTRLFNESSTYGRLFNNSGKVNNPTILNNWNKKNKSFKLSLLYILAEKIGAWSSKKYNRILKLEQNAKKHWSRSVIDKYKKDLELLKPTCVFITHQRVSGLMPICIAAKELGIPVVTAIYSWDNIPKARLAVDTDRYIVWSAYMKEEMQLYYPEIDSSKVIITGTPQFEFYSQKNRIESREIFAKKNNLNPNKKWICFSGDDKKSSPYDPIYLEDIAKSVSEMNEQDRPLIVFRRCPVDYSNRYDKVLKDYKDLIVSIDPLWNTPKAGKNWGYIFPRYEDVNMQVNLAFHCELVINLGSTMAHDFAAYNKPCFYLNYNPVISKHWSVAIIYNFQHFRSMKDLDAVGWLNNKEEIKTKIEQGLIIPNDLAKDRLTWMNIIVTKIDESSQLIANVLK